MAQASLDRRDRRKGHAIAERLRFASDHEHVAIIAAALKREREDCDRDWQHALVVRDLAETLRAKAKRAIQAKGKVKR